MGTCSPCSTQGYRFYTIFVDDFSRYVWWFPLRHKSDFYDCFKIFQKFIERQMDKKIQIFQLDGGGEFSSRTFKIHLENDGIKHQISCPGTPEQNNVAEKKHLHIMELGLVMMFKAFIPRHYWVEAFFTAVFLINRLPSVKLEMKSPYNLIYQKVSDYSYLRIFGCRCFPYLRHYTADKFSLRSLPCVFLGYSDKHKGYPCFHPPT